METKVKESYLLLLIFVISFLVYLPALKAPFFWDDTLMVPGLKEYPTVKGQHTEFRPLRTCSFYLDSFLWKTNASGYHFTNIFLNALAAITAFCFIDFFFKNKVFSFLTALLFVLHPVHTETVIWIKNRTEILFFIFFILSFISFFKKQKLSYPFFVISLLAKESAVIFPLVLMIYIFIFGQKKEIKRTIPFWILSFARLIIGTVWVSELVGKGGVTNLGTHLLAIVKTYVFYFYLLIFPKNLCIDWRLDLAPGNPYNLLSFLAMVLFFFLVYLVRKRKNFLFFLSLLFVSLLPYANIVFITGRPWAEQRLYLPSLIFCVLLGMILLSRKPTPDVLKYLFIVIVILYGFRTITRAIQWQNPQVLWEEVKKFSPRSRSRTELNLGNAYYEKGNFDKAREHYLKAFELNPKDSYTALYNLGLVFMKTGNLPTSIECFQKVLEIKPEHVPSYYNLGVTYLRLKNYKEAINSLEKAKEIDPSESQIFNNLAVAYKRNGEPLKAIEVLKDILKLKPDYFNARYNLAVIYKKAGKYDEAMKEVKYVLKKEPKNPAFLNLYQELIR